MLLFQFSINDYYWSNKIIDGPIRTIVTEITICIDQLSIVIFVFYSFTSYQKHFKAKCCIMVLIIITSIICWLLKLLYFLLLGNKWNLKKFVPYSEMLESISQKWPNIERLSDHPNDTSKVFVQISLWYLSSMQNISPFLIGSNPLVNLALTKFGKQLQNTENDVNNTE